MKPYLDGLSAPPYLLGIHPIDHVRCTLDP